MDRVGRALTPPSYLPVGPRRLPVGGRSLTLWRNSFASDQQSGPADMHCESNGADSPTLPRHARYACLTRAER